MRKLDGHPQPSLWACLEFDGSVVGGGDGCDDGQTQPDPAIGAGALGAASPERPAQLADLGGVEDRTAVLDDQPGGWALSRGRDLHPPAGLVVADGVVDQVDGQAGKECCGCRRPPPRQDCAAGSRWLRRHRRLGCRERPR